MINLFERQDAKNRSGLVWKVCVCSDIRTLVDIPSNQRTIGPVNAHLIS